MQRILVSCLLWLSATSSACQTTPKSMRLTPEGSLVETTTVAPSDTCSMVHDATGRGTAGDTTAATLRARADIRNRAARMGGNVVLLETQTTRVLPSGTLEVVIFGKVYKCRK